MKPREAVSTALETQAVISKPRPNPRIRRFLITVHNLGRSGSGLVERPGFQKLVAQVCSGSIGAVLCIEASRLARNGRDWHHLIDLCALTGTLVIDPDGIYDPRVMNDRLLLGLKGTMSEYELSLLRQRGLAARDSKAKRGELRYALPPGYCWDELGRVVLDCDEWVVESVRLFFRKFRELGSARQVLLWAREAGLDFPVIHQSRAVRQHISWHYPAYHNVISMLRHPLYAGAYVFGRTTQRTKVVEGRARKTTGHHKPMQDWSVLLRDHHPGYISWAEFEENQQTLSESAHMQKRTSRKGARGGRALLTGLARCGRCARMMRIFYGSQASHAHRYQCIGEHIGNGISLGIGGVRVDQAIARALLEVVSNYAVKAAILAEERFAHAQDDVQKALLHELEEAQYEASLASRRYEAVDPAKRLVAASSSRAGTPLWSAQRSFRSVWRGCRRAAPNAGLLTEQRSSLWRKICPPSGTRLMPMLEPNSGSCASSSLKPSSISMTRRMKSSSRSTGSVDDTRRCASRA